MAIANGTCVSFCNQPKAHFGLLWVRPWDNRSKCHMDEERIQCLSNASQHVPIYLQPFPSNSTRKFKSSLFFAHFGLPWVRPWDNRGSVTWIKRGFNASQTHSSNAIPIYLQPFTSYIVRYWLEIATFPYHLAFNALVEGDPLELDNLRYFWWMSCQATIWCKISPKS